MAHPRPLSPLCRPAARVQDCQCSTATEDHFRQAGRARASLLRGRVTAGLMRSPRRSAPPDNSNRCPGICTACLASAHALPQAEGRQGRTRSASCPPAASSAPRLSTRMIPRATSRVGHLNSPGWAPCQCPPACRRRCCLLPPRTCLLACLLELQRLGLVHRWLARAIMQRDCTINNNPRCPSAAMQAPAASAARGHFASRVWRTISNEMPS